MDAKVISIGSELATGQTVDTNSAWLSQRLTDLGLAVRQHVTVSDDMGDLVETLGVALARPGVIVVTGGLGPTADDLTRQAVGIALSAPLEESTDAWMQIKDYFAKRQRPMPDSNRLQALLPRGCRVIRNDVGTAPGIAWRDDQVRLFVLPGVPSEMRQMFEQSVAPELMKLELGLHRICVIQTSGMSEAHIGELIADLMQRGRNPSVGTTASRSVIGVRIVARGADPEEAQRLLMADAAKIRTRLGTAVYGENEDTLEAVIGQMLLAQNATLATAESCTGGLLAKYITDVPGSSAYFLRGLVTYSNASKVQLLGIPQELLAAHGAVSEEVVKAMAEGCRKQAGATYAVSTTGVAGPGGGSVQKPVGLVYVGVADPMGVKSHRLLLGETIGREEIRERTCRVALNALRMSLRST